MVFVWKGIRKNIVSYYSSAFPINPQPRRRSVRSHSVLFVVIVNLFFFKNQSLETFFHGFRIPFPSP